MLQKEVERFVYDALFANIKSSLQTFTTLKQWDAQPTRNSPYELPSFSLSPSGYITQIGEHLLTLPQQLETLHQHHNHQADEEGSHLADQAHYWLDMVSKGTVEALQERIMLLPRLSDSGAKQLAADIDYLFNVMSALSESPHPSLKVMSSLLSTPKEEFIKTMATTISSPSDKRIALKVAQLRGIAL
eukprot:GEZU01019076.1.p1 GENE.GEZU01019076.1~~GEZU01019076.1.p1  ORF type:complete len:188 (-),score=51.84 GEZU01019076.1:400-963(-)